MKADRIRMHTDCSVDGCTAPHNAKGFCGAHYRNFRRHGTPIGRYTRRLPAKHIASLRALVHLDPAGPTAEQVERWELQEAAS